MNVKMIVTDLDGTLARSDSQICPVDIETLKTLGTMNVYRVIATGRSLYSARKVLAEDCPIDYLVLSSGAGIMDWKRQRIINAESLERPLVKRIAESLIESRIDFSIQDPIPANHRFSYSRPNPDNADFNRRLDIYREFARPLVFDEIGDASQIIAILDNNVEHFNRLKKRFDEVDVKIIRATSPLDGKSIWMEFFPAHVSKSFGIDYLCRLLAVDRRQTVGIGNDYNDLDLLRFCERSFVVENAPAELKALYPSVASNDMNGFTDLINRLTSHS